MRQLVLYLVLGLNLGGCAGAGTVETRADGRDPEVVRAEAVRFLELGHQRRARARAGESLAGAIQAYQAALAVDPLLFQGHLGLARCHYLAGDYALEQGEYLKATALQPRCVEAWERLGHARLSMDDLDGAHAAYERVLELDPLNGQVLYNLGQVEDDLGRPDRAQELFERARRVEAARRPIDRGGPDGPPRTPSSQVQEP